MTGYVYAIDDGHGRVKIGWSRNPLRRLVKLRSDCPTNVNLIGVVAASLSQETEAHALLAPWCIGGEWFDGSAPTVAAFVSMLPRPAAQLAKQFGKGRAHPLAQYRAQHRITLAHLAKQLGLSHSTLCRYESGKTTPSPDAIRRIRALTGITADALFWSGA